MVLAVQDLRAGSGLGGVTFGVLRARRRTRFHPPMTSPVACILCSIDPNMPSLVLPVAQATVLAAPILLRDHVKRGAKAVAGRLRDGAGVDDGSSTVDDDSDPGDLETA